ncbi:MAG TPA: hypothetical protein VGQ95_12530 [Chthoniobacterales bacterium]|nr:hypothetical protein [Chthoniobacterales bacterium]
MKTRLILVLSVLGLVGAGCSWMSQGGGSSSEENLCLIRFSADSVPQPKVDQIIKRLQQDTKYPENYKVRQWKNGKPVLTIGNMRIAQAELKKMDTNAKNSGLTALTYRVGMFTSCDPKMIPNLIDAKKLAQEINKIQKNH